ncbi:Hypothetical predicted protein [Paramuricea clavata]|uniref:Uncharacterized protein n=1 Tax=Paramuricea clavata TaxID=317549 RepID=A0A7D9LF12_PARCT|nr:Hypothetical predicted protein [Paramuricea clavata]
MLQEELDYKSIEEIYWTDSKVVLGYINNDARRFHVFVANRVQQIRDHSSKDQWNYVESKLNPADEASRGLKACDIVSDSRLLRQRVRKKREEKDVENIEKAATVMKPDQAVTVEEMNAAEREIIKALQKEEFKQEISSLKSKPKVNVLETQGRRNTVARTSPIAKLDPFMDEHGVI